ncbi:MAG: AraC family transcriptional regulator, partial [Victivallales bacterium]
MIINPDIVEPEVLTGARSVLGKEWSREGGSEPYSRLYYVESGTGYLRHHGRKFILGSGNMYLIPAHSELSYGCTGKIVISWLHFTSHLRNGADLFETAGCPYETRPEEKMFVEGILKRIFIFMEKDSPCAGFEIRGCLLLLLSQLLRHSGADMQTASHDKFRRFIPVLSHIQSNPSQKISVGKMASMVKMAPESFSRAFSKCFSTSPAEYVRRKKISLARMLLEDSNRKLGDIAE